MGRPSKKWTGILATHLPRNATPDEIDKRFNALYEKYSIDKNFSKLCCSKNPNNTDKDVEILMLQELVEKLLKELKCYALTIGQEPKKINYFKSENEKVIIFLNIIKISIENEISIDKAIEQYIEKNNITSTFEIQANIENSKEKILKVLNAESIQRYFEDIKKNNICYDDKKSIAEAVLSENNCLATSDNIKKILNYSIRNNVDFMLNKHNQISNVINMIIQIEKRNKT